MLIKTLILLSIGYPGLIYLMYAMQRRFIYIPDRRVPDISKAPWAELIEIKTADGLILKSWWCPPKDDGKPVISFFHGNADNIETRIPKAEVFIERGYGVLLPEYRGYGGNPGSPTEEGLYHDARAHLEWLLKDRKIKPENLILYGESLGSGVAVQMATEYKAKALILDVPYFSVLEMCRFRAPFIPFMEKLAKDQYRSDLKINNLNLPVFVGVGERDIVIPQQFGTKLFEAANEPKKYMKYPKAGHLGIYDKGFGEDVIAFIEAQDIATRYS